MKKKPGLLLLMVWIYLIFTGCAAKPSADNIVVEISTDAEILGKR